VSSLFAKLYLDENVSILLDALLRHRGFCATTAHAAGLLHADDIVHLSYASTNGYCLVTHNREDFRKIHDQMLATQQRHMGIIIAYFHDEYILVKRLAKLLDTLTADEFINQLFYI